MGMIWINRVCLYYEYVYMCQLWCSDWYIMPNVLGYEFSFSVNYFGTVQLY